MNSKFSNIKSLDQLNRGFDKHWIYENDFNFNLAHDFLQKINYSIQDINEIISEGFPLKQRSKVIYFIMLITWIDEAILQLQNCCRKGILKNFEYSKVEEMERNTKYLKAVRSLLSAHPLTTNRHKYFGLDGNLICIDIGTKNGIFASKLRGPFIELRPNGKTETEKINDTSIVIYSYSKEEGAENFKFILLYPQDLINVASIYIDRLYKMNVYLSHQHKKDYRL